MQLGQYIEKLVELGYGRKEAEFICISNAWSQVQLENTVKCQEVLYDIEGDNIKDGFKYSWRSGILKDSDDNPRKAVFKIEDLGERLACTVDMYKYEYKG